MLAILKILLFSCSIEVVLCLGAVRCQSLTQYFFETHGYCYFLPTGLPVASYEEAVAGCQQYFGAELAIFPDDSLQGPVLNSIKPLLTAACASPSVTHACSHLRIGAARSLNAGTMWQHWEWRLPHGNQIELPSSVISAHAWAPFTNSAIIASNAGHNTMFIEMATIAWTPSTVDYKAHTFLCQIRSSTLKWQSKAGQGSNSSVTMEFTGIGESMKCAEECRQSLACLVFTFIESSAICRLHWKTMSELEVMMDPEALIYDLIE